MDCPCTLAHHRNIERYRNLLKTQLTSVERDFVKRRLSEERASLRQVSIARRRALTGFPVQSGPVTSFQSVRDAL